MTYAIAIIEFRAFGTNIRILGMNDYIPKV